MLPGENDIYFIDGEPVLTNWGFVPAAVGEDPEAQQRHFRATLGRGILLGLEFLIAADIIRTVTLTPTLDSLLVLAGIVVVRTFLSLSLQVEIEGRWPWQPARNKS